MEPLQFHMNLESACKFLQISGILIGITSHLWITLGSIANLTILNLPIHEHECSSVYLNHQFLSKLFCSFYINCTSFVKCIPIDFNLFDAIVNEILFLISFLDCSLQRFRI